MGLPRIEIIFKQKAVTAVKRSQLGIVGLIVKESSKDWSRKVYKNISEIVDKDYTEENLGFVSDTFTFTPSKVVVYNIGSGSLKDTLKIVAQERINWVGLAYDGSDSDNAILVSWIKSMRKNGKTYKAVVHKVENPNEKGIVNLMNSKVTFTDARGEKDGWYYIPSLLGLFAGCPMTRSTTSYLLGNLKDVDIFDDVDKVIDDGGLCLIKDDDDIRIGRGINSLKEITKEETEDMKSIIIVESMDLMRDDLYSTFKKWVGKYKNSYDNQVLFFSAINGYFKELAREEILDNAYDNYAEVDVEAQRIAWEKVGKAEDIAKMTDLEVKKLSFKTSVFMKANIKILNAVEDFYFNINMF